MLKEDYRGVTWEETGRSYIKYDFSINQNIMTEMYNETIQCSTGVMLYKLLFVLFDKYCDLWVKLCHSDDHRDHGDDKRRGLAWQQLVLVECHKQQICQGWWVTWGQSILYISLLLHNAVFHGDVRLQQGFSPFCNFIPFPVNIFL